MNALLSGALNIILPIAAKKIPNVEAGLIDFFKSQPVPEGFTTKTEITDDEFKIITSARYRFGFSIMENQGQLFAVPSIFDAETNVVTQTKFELNGIEYDAIPLRDYLVQLLNNLPNYV